MYESYETKTLLHFAVERNSPELVRAILSSDFENIDLKDAPGNTALIYAAKRKFSEVMKVLAEEGKADTALVNNKNKDALHYVTQPETIVDPKEPECVKALG